jgi:hypothetical protein
MQGGCFLVAPRGRRMRAPLPAVDTNLSGFGGEETLAVSSWAQIPLDVVRGLPNSWPTSGFGIRPKLRPITGPLLTFVKPDEISEIYLLKKFKKYTSAHAFSKYTPAIRQHYYLTSDRSSLHFHWMAYEAPKIHRRRRAVKNSETTTHAVKEHLSPTLSSWEASTLSSWEDLYRLMEWPPSPLKLHVFSSMTRQWEERSSFDREGDTVASVEDALDRIRYKGLSSSLYIIGATLHTRKEHYTYTVTVLLQ